MLDSIDSEMDRHVEKSRCYEGVTENNVRQYIRDDFRWMMMFDIEFLY